VRVVGPRYENGDVRGAVRGARNVEKTVL
jgi:hypothetical protein